MLFRSSFALSVTPLQEEVDDVAAEIIDAADGDNYLYNLLSAPQRHAPSPPPPQAPLPSRPNPVYLLHT